MESIAILPSLALYFFAWLCFYVLTSNLRSRRSSRAPPGPYKLPIIGNLHQIGKNPHQSFAKLSKKYGPLMSLRLGSKEAVVVSSAEIAREILLRNGQICSSRSVPNAIHALDHNKFSVAWMPVSSTWRNIRKVCREQMFSQQRLDASQDLRQEKIKELLDYVDSCSSHRKAMDIGGAVFITSLNFISRTLFSADFANYDSNSSQELKEIVFGVMENIGIPNISDYFPVLQLIDPQGIKRDNELYFRQLLNIFDGFIKERLLARKASESILTKKSDLLEGLLDENLRKESEFSIDILKHLLLDLFLAGIDTTSGTVEWAMAELLRNPEKRKKAREEVKRVIGEKTLVQESDISRLPYLQAVVKETFRLHPAAPLLIPRKTNGDVEINGYKVPKDTEILINVWAYGRDEGTWKQPELFEPERFLGSEIDVKGQHFELIPFGAGGRICPGLPLGYRMVHLMLASFIHNFDWEIEGGIKPEDLDMEERFGITIQKAAQLRAVPVKV